MASSVSPLSRYKSIANLLASVALSLGIIASNGSPVIIQTRALVMEASAYLYMPFQYVETLFTITKDYRELQQEHIKSQIEVNKSRTLSQENQRLRKMLGFKGGKRFQVIPANVLSDVGSHTMNSLTVDQGFKDGVSLLSGVVDSDAQLVGKVVAVSDNTALVQTVNAAPSIGNLQQIVQDINARLSQYVENNKIVVEVSEDRVILRFISTQLFPSGSARVNLQELPEVNDLVQAILAHSDSVIIVGHTDSTGRADSNWVLSRQRAEAIETWIKTAQATITQTNTRGVADTQPLVSGKDQSQNRRVELILVPKHRL